MPPVNDREWMVSYDWLCSQRRNAPPDLDIWDLRCFDSDEVFYARYMDDFLLLNRTRWQLRRGISRLAEFFDLSGFERHPEKTTDLSCGQEI